MASRHALVGAYTVPEPDRDSGSKRIDDTVAFLLDDGWQVTYVTTVPARSERDAHRLRSLGVPVLHLGPEQLAAHVASVPYAVAIFAFWPTAELFVPVVRRVSPTTRIVVDSIDIHFVRHARRSLSLEQGAQLLDEQFADQMVSELNTYSAADMVLTVSRKEAELINDLAAQPDLAFTVPDNEESSVEGRPYSERRGALFVGSFRHPPNIDAVAFLCREVAPRLPASLLGVHPISVVGDALSEPVRAFADGLPGIRMVGWVPSLDAYYAQARITILPLLSGAGTKRKLIQALARGTPTVSTSIGAEGLDLIDGRDILIANDPTTFANAMETALYDETLWHTLAGNGRRRIADTHGRDAARTALRDAIETVLQRTPKGTLLPDRTYDHHHERLVYQHHQSLILPATSAATRADERSGLELMPPADVRFPDDPVRLIAFYLPQFHPIPENDAWWGDGFTEWTNVRKATPIFPGHLQPRVPTELGYYDLRDAEVRSAQAELARQHGLHGFCYYHYWFGGKRLLERPFEEVLATSEPDFPFAICWANEPWSRRWDGSKHDVLQPQLYGPDDDLAHIHALLPALADPRAIKVAGKALLLIYQGWSLPDAGRLTDLWRSEVIKAGLPGLHLVTVETGWDAGWDATQVGFDAKIRFQPQFTVLDTVHRLNVSDCEGLKVYPYADAWPVLHHLPAAPYPTYETVFPGWDNSPRRGSRGVVVHGGTPAEYGEWLRREIDRARSLPPGQRIVFINAWNEWAEGAYLEPDTAFGRGFLEATRTAAQAGVTRPGILGPLR